jgi:hypothetical protein
MIELMIYTTEDGELHGAGTTMGSSVVERALEHKALRITSEKRLKP